MQRFICDNIGQTEDGVLTFAGKRVDTLIRTYGSALYLMDEDKLRQNMRVYVGAMKNYFGEGSYPLYASKACAFKQMYRIAREEGMGVDVVSAGELYTAVSAGYPAEKICFHGSNKTDAEIDYAVSVRIGRFIVDGFEELEAIDRIARAKGVKQKVVLRLTPGIDTHTYEAVNTGKVDSKFGIAIETGEAEKFVKAALSYENIDLVGYHCHIGSQVFDSVVFFDSAHIMLAFIRDMRDKYGFAPEELNLGGGYGVRYVDDDPYIDIDANIRTVAEVVKKACGEIGIAMPRMRMEPGRSIVADAGMTLYTVGAVKRIPDVKTYVSIDGGMTDNPRFALYGSKYTVYAADKMNDDCYMRCTLVGRCCESGDIIAENILLPASMQRGDIVAVATTGAYNYSMASNYNRVARLPVIMLGKDTEYVAVRRETAEDMVRCDL